MNKQSTMQRGAVALAALLVGLAAGDAAAQAPAADARWQAWLGCWQPVGEAAVGEAAPLVCVVPSAGSTVEMLTVADGRVAERQRLDASGTQVAVSREGCAGWESAQWSPDGQRVYRRAELDCQGGLQRTATGLMTMSATGEWLDVQGVSAGGNTGVRVIRYQPVQQGQEVPAEIRAALGDRALAIATARTAASAPPTTDDVLEASRLLDPAVVEAWLIEREHGFAMELNARRLLQLREAGMPERVIDLVVALSYPEVFAIDRSNREGEFRPEDSTDRSRRPRTVYLGDFGYPGYGGYYPGYGYGYGRGYGRYYGGRPVVIVQRDGDGEGAERARPRVVKGRGYTRGNSGGGSVDTPSRPSSSAGSVTRSGGSSSGGSSSGGSGRTAKPRGD
jgi:hypothetical protein